MTHHNTGLPTNDDSRIVEHSDGFYWVDVDTGLEFGPFPSVALAIADMDSSTELNNEADETLLEAEAELGISNWIDPETGAPAEDSIPHIED